MGEKDAPLAPANPVGVQARVVDAFELDNLVTDDLKHTPDLPVSALVNLEPHGMPRLRFVVGYFVCFRHAIVELHTSSQSIEFVWLNRLLRTHEV